jgi:hypothetical protein
MGNLVLLKDVICQLEQLGGASFNFGPQYFADLENADRERMRTAKRLIAGGELARMVYLEKLRIYRDGATHCAWCSNALIELRHTRAIGGKLLHLSCADLFGRTYQEWSCRVELTSRGRAALRQESRAKLCVGCRQPYFADPASELSFCASCEALEAPHGVAV